MADWGLGTVLAYESATPGTYTAVGEVVEVAGPSISVDAIDTTHHGNTDGWRRKIAGLADGGEVTFTIQLEPGDATHGISAGTGVVSQIGTANKNWRITGPSGHNYRWAFSGFVSAFSASYPIDDKITADVTITISGKPTLEASS